MSDQFTTKPPRWPIVLLRRICSSLQLEILEGDLLELYEERLITMSKWKADGLFILETLELSWRTWAARKQRKSNIQVTLLYSYLVISLRQLVKNKTSSFVSIFSLFISLVFSIMIFSYVQYEKSYDQYLPNLDNKYRMVFDIYGGSGRNIHDAESPAPFAPFFAEKVPGISSYTRVFDHRNVMLSNPGVRSMKVPTLAWADANVLDYFGIDMMIGKSQIEDKNSIWLSNSTAIQLFGSVEEAMGQTVRFNDSKTLSVKGIFENFPMNSTVKLDAIGALDVLQEIIPWYYQNGENWGGFAFHTYYTLDSATDWSTLPDQFREHYYDRFDIDINDPPEEYYDFDLIKVSDIHLHSDMDGEMRPPSDLAKLNLLEYLAFVIAVIGWINFINIQSARAPERLKEIGIRISLGAGAVSLRLMFFIEHLLICSFSLIMAALVAIYGISDIVQQVLHIQLPTFKLNGAAIAALSIGSLLASFYPALVTSSQIKRGVVKTLNKHRSGKLRQVLITMQFVISLFLMVFTLVIYQQISFMNSLDPGFNSESLLIIDGPVTTSEDDDLRAARFKEELEKLADIEQATYSTLAPGKNKGWDANLPARDGENSSTQKVNLANVFPEFFDILEIEAIAGRIPNGPQQTENLPRVIMNESAVKNFNWTPEQAIGKKVGYSDDAVVVAVVEDIKTVGFQEQLAPMVFVYDHVFFQHTTNDYFLAEVNSLSILSIMHEIEQTYMKIFPDNDFTFNFSNELFDEQYQYERDFNRLIVTFSTLSIVLSLIGLMGITFYHVILKRKEIGIRKVLGSSVSSILNLFIKKYLYLLLFSALIALPTAYFFVDHWLSDFAYRIDVSLWILTAPFVLMVALVCFIVSMSSLQAAQVNPVEVLKEE